jgi:hypoxanthine phosphoribosyltransferase
MENLPGRVLLSRGQIETRVGELGAQIASDLQEELRREGSSETEPGRVVLIPVLTGAFVFVADLIRKMPLHLSMQMVSVSSYPGATTESKGVLLQDAIPEDLEGMHVLLVDDILDTGQTLALLQRLIREKRPASLRTCVLLTKQCKRVEHAEAEYSGFDIEPEFVVGYGLDYNGHYRNLPEICVLDPVYWDET